MIRFLESFFMIQILVSDYAHVHDILSTLKSARPHFKNVSINAVEHYRKNTTYVNKKETCLLVLGHGCSLMSTFASQFYSEKNQIRTKGNILTIWASSTPKICDKTVAGKVAAVWTGSSQFHLSPLMSVLSPATNPNNVKSTVASFRT